MYVSCMYVRFMYVCMYICMYAPIYYMNCSFRGKRLLNVNCALLSAFTKLQKATISLVMSVRPSSVVFSKICPENSSFITI